MTTLYRLRDFSRMYLYSLRMLHIAALEQRVAKYLFLYLQRFRKILSSHVTSCAKFWESKWISHYSNYQYEKQEYTKKTRRHTSRTNVPFGDSSPSGSFIDIVTERDYSHRPRAIDEMGEVGFLNSKEPLACPYCGSFSIIKQGFGENHMRRYGCKKCGRRFNILTNTIFENHKLSISEWVGFLLDIIGFSSFNLTSKINRNSINT